MGHVYVESFWRGGYGRISGRLRVTVGVGGGKSGSNAGEGRSLLVEQHFKVELTQEGGGGAP
jgi:hypothetical protein